MTEVNWSLDPTQAFGNQPRGRSPVGYLKALTIGDSITLPTDLPVHVPGQALASGAAVLTSIEWGGGATDPMSFSGVISIPSKHAVGNISSQSLSSAKVSVGFSIWAYDQLAETYFAAFHTGDVDVSGYVKTRPAGAGGSPFEIRFDTEPTTGMTNTGVIRFSMTIVPAAEEMDLHVATASQQVQVWTWGVAAA